MHSSEQGGRLAAHLFHLASLCLNIRHTISLDSVVKHICPFPTVVVVTTATSSAWKSREYQERTSETSAKVTHRTFVWLLFFFWDSTSDVTCCRPSDLLDRAAGVVREGKRCESGSWTPEDL